MLDRQELNENKSDFIYVEAEIVFQTLISADVFINIASMQEMDPHIIQKYFQMIRHQPQETYFYCCNRVQKTLPDGTITRFFEYGWEPEDAILVDELCPWHQEAPMNRPPFKYRFDGPTHHRLIKLK